MIKRIREYIGRNTGIIIVATSIMLFCFPVLIIPVSVFFAVVYVSQ